MDIRYQNAFQTNETTDLQVLTNLQEQFLQCFVNSHCAAGNGSSLQSLYVSRILLNDGICNQIHKCLEFVSICNEVCLGVYLDNAAYGIVCIYLCNNHTLCCNTASLLRLCCQTFFTQQLNCLLYVAVCFGQSLFAVHHANTGGLTQFVNIFCCKISHWMIPP
ncbi:putative uncharacterized protein [Ruminococcus sp. CAG:330]|nr:putative uncharacterized protein [Ruminococcus sp. CAG:330]